MTVYRRNAIILVKIWNNYTFNEIYIILHSDEVEATGWDLSVVSRVPDDLVVGLYVEGAPVDGLDVVDTVVDVNIVVGAIVVAVAVVGCFVVGTGVVVVVGAGVVVLAVVVVVVGIGVVVVGACVVVVVVGGCDVLVDGGVWVNVGKLGSPLQFRVRAAVESSTIVMIYVVLLNTMFR